LKVGIIGVGRMGLAMAKRLAGRGLDVVGWDLDPSRGESLAEVGAKGCTTPADVVARSEVILSIVTDDAAVRSLFESPSGLLASRADGKLFVEMSTVQPETIRQAAARAEHAGARLVGAPVLGSIPTVDEGKLLVLAGGRPEDIEAAKVVLAHLAREVIAIGPIGSGNAMKLIVNLSMAAYLEALAEGLSLGLEEGLTIRQMLDVLGAAPTANPWLAMKREVLLGAPGATTLDLATLRKDVLDAVATGSADGVAMPMAAGILSSLSAAVACGFGGEDLGQLPRFYRDHMVRRPASALK
jgi:3-hydroxyisobutyrate dehydrogenase-like beta-hydroxyacid dehydrogenase